MDFETERLKLLADLRGQIKDARVLRAMAKIPRELFVPEGHRVLAYDDRPLPIGFGQTISQPFIVAMMTEALALTGSEKVLEVGTGSGYQAAILAELAREVITVERVPELAERARKILSQLVYRNVEVRPAGATLGWLEGAPYDGIIVTAGAPKVPQSLLEQLSVGGRMVIPVGSRYEQELLKVTKRQDKVITVSLGGCRFVPLIGPEAWQEEVEGVGQ